MRSYHIYFLFLILLQACKENSKQAAEQNLFSQSQPLIVPLNMAEGYVINKITGDSIRPLINSTGDTTRTGIPYSITPEKVDAPGIKHPVIIQDNSQVKTIIESNIHPLKGKPEQVPASPTEIPSIAISANSDSIILQNSSHILFTHRSFPVTIKKILLHEPMPVKIQSMRYKDNALQDIQYLDIGQGLPYSYIYTMLQDKNGYLWLGTDYGLCKYDGTFLTVYTENEGLINNKVTSIEEDKNGRLWIGTYGGITVFDGIVFLQFADKDGLLTHYAGDIQRDAKENLWITLENIGIVSVDENVFTLYSTKNNFPVKIVPEFHVDQKGVFWISSPTGLISYDGKRFVYFNPGSEILQAITKTLEDNKGNTWFLSNRSGLTKFDGNFFTHYTTDNGLSDNSLISLMIDNRDNVWLGTRYGGVNKFDGKNFTIFNSQQGLSEDKIGCTLEDKQGNIWIGTLGGGVNKLNDNGFLEKISLSRLNNSRVRPIIKDKFGNLWFGTEAGDLYSYDGKDLTHHIKRKAGSLTGFRSVMTDKENNLWFGEQEGSGFYKYDYKQFRYFSPPTKNSSNLSLFQDNSGAIWVGTTKEGVAVFNGGSLEYYKESNGFSSDRVFVTKQDKKGNLWFGTEGGGLVKYDGKVFTVFSEKQGLFCKSITSILEDEDGNLWLGTLEAGLSKFDGNSFTYYTEKQGLAFNSIWSLKKDEFGQLWVGTDNGLSVLNTGKKTERTTEAKYSIYSFGLQDGLKATDFNLNGVCIDNTNRIWWGTGKALITRDLTIPIYSDTPQTLKLNYITVNDQFRDFRNVSDKLKNKISFSSIQPFQNYPDDLSLSYDHNHITFHFSAIDWSAPGKIKYSYRLLGSDTKWSDPSADAFADYRNLNHGSYELQVKAIGQSQVWTEPISYHFIIKAAWWQTWWFKAAASALTIFVMVYALWLIYLYRLRKQKTLLEKKLAVQYERQRISADLHDDIGSTLSSINIYAGLAKKQSDNQLYLDSISQNINEVVNKLDDLVWSIKAGHDTLGNIVERIKIYAAPITRSKQIDLVIHINEDTKNIKPPEDSKHHLYMVTKELINNAIKHADCKHIEIEFKKEKNILIVTVKDDGKGFDENKIRKDRNGLKNISGRVNEMAGRIDIRSSLKEGTVVTIGIQV